MRGCLALLLLLSFAIVTPSLGQICAPCHAVHGGVPRGLHMFGVGRCSMCHTMHNSQDGAPVDPDSPSGNPWLLIASTPSDVCLSCHANWISFVFGTDPLNPPTLVGAGNFVYLLEDNINDGENGANHPIGGHAAGHSIVAPSRGVGPDPILTRAPGGTFHSTDLGCTSCHDPHGNQNYRMLYGAGQPIQGGIYTFVNPAPDARGMSIYHGRERNTKHNAYRSGMSAWCANCHGEFHGDNGRFMHPTGASLGAVISTAYGRYNGTVNPTGGSPATSYLAAVPFEDPSVTLISRHGPAASSRVMCLSCHRAHATSAPDAGRWDFNVTFLRDDGVESGSYRIPDPYDNPAQKSLCNKCHVKDEFDRIP